MWWSLGPSRPSNLSLPCPTPLHRGRTFASVFFLGGGRNLVCHASDAILISHHLILLLFTSSVLQNTHHTWTKRGDDAQAPMVQPHVHPRAETRPAPQNRPRIGSPALTPKGPNRPPWLAAAHQATPRRLHTTRRRCSSPTRSISGRPPCLSASQAARTRPCRRRLA